MIRRMFLDHPASIGESYAEHFGVASRFGWRLTKAGVASMIHAILPCLFETKGSDTVRDLHDQFVAKRNAIRADNIQMATIEYVI